MSNCQSLYHLSVCESLKIEIKEGINFFCSLLAPQRAGEMGWGVHRVLCLPGACLGLPQVGFVTFVSLKLPKVPAGLLLADLRCSPLWARTWSADSTQTPPPSLHDSCLWILPVCLDPLLQFSSGISCVLRVLDLLGFCPCCAFCQNYFICKHKLGYCAEPSDASSVLSSNLDLSLQPSPCMFSQQLRLSVAKPGLLILTPRGLSLTSFSESWAKYQHHLLFSPVNSAFSTHC